MIQDIKEIGSLQRKFGIRIPDSIVEIPKQAERQKSKGKESYIIRCEFNLKDNSFTIRPEKYSESSPKKYLFVGNADRNNPKDRLTTTGDNARFLLSETIPTLIDNIEDSVLKDTLIKVKDKFFYSPDKKTWVLDLNKCNIANESMDELLERANKKPKDFVKSLKKMFDNYIKDQLDISEKEIAFYTIVVDGKILAQDEAYKKYIDKIQVKDAFKNTKKGTCYICGKKDVNVTYNTKRFKFKYYITDKISFSSNIKGGNAFLKNLALCEDCYRDIMSGEAFVKNKLRTRLAGATLYIIPKFIYPEYIEMQDINEWADFIKDFVNSAQALENLQEFRKKIKKDINNYDKYMNQKNQFMLNLLFAMDNGQAFKVLRLIKDVPPSRFDLLIETADKVKKMANKLLSESNLWHLGFTNMYYLFPVKKNSIDKKMIDFYDCLVSSKHISYNFLIDNFVELAKVYAYEQFNQYNVDKGDIIYPILRQNLLLKYLRKINLTEGGEGMPIDDLHVDDGMKEFIKEMDYTELQTAMFLIGYLVGEVGNAQRNSGLETKPILYKIVYQGMGKQKIIVLLNEIFEKLHQYKKLRYNEAVFSDAKKLLDKNINSWTLSDRENVFYILSGYAYNTRKIITRKKEETKDDVQ